MAFWNQNKLPAEYRNLSEDEIAAQLAAGKTAAAEATTQKAAIDAANAAKLKADTDLAEANRKLAGVSEWVENAKKNGVSPEGGRSEQPPAGPPDAASWLTDPNDAFSRAVGPTAAVALHGAIMSARLLADQFISRQGPVEARLWAKYSGDVEKIVNGLPPDQRILPQTWINQFTFVKGMHLNDVVKEAQGAGDAFFSETASSTGSGLPERSESQNDKLTPAEEAIAKKLGRTPEQYLARKKSMTFGPAL